MEGLAKAGGGTSEFVKDGERMQAKVNYDSNNSTVYKDSLCVQMYITTRG